MKKMSYCLSVCLFAAATAAVVCAQPPEGAPREGAPREGGRGFGGGPGFGGPGFGPGGGPGMMMRAMPIMAALDADKDGVISSEEIDNAVAALKSVDKNNDGKITEEEMRPSFPGRDGGPGSGRPGARPGEGRGREAAEGRGEGRGREGGEGRGGNPEEMLSRVMQMDKNGDGKLAMDEVGERLQSMITRADADKDGFATREELIAMMAANRSEARGGEPRGADARSGEARGGEAREGGRPQRGAPAAAGFIDRMFEFDADGDGKLSREELGKMAERFGAEGGPRGFGGGFGGGQGGGRPSRPPAE